jgi:(p)ppGpp synthase/HD superfamily hydrolase
MNDQTIDHNSREYLRALARLFAYRSGTYAHASRVAQLAELHGAHFDTVTAAWLHDVVEDSDVTLREISRSFPKNITRMVFDLTNQCVEGPRGLRKRREADRLMSCPFPVRLVKACDRLDNLSRIARKSGWNAAFLNLYAEESLYLLNQIAHDLPARLVGEVKEAAHALLIP